MSTRPDQTSARVGYLIKRVQQALRAAMDTTLAEAGITTPQYAVLASLEEEPGLSSAELARRSFVTAQTMGGIVANLERSHLVERTPHPDHGRVLATRLTGDGIHALERAHAAADRVEAAMLGGLSAEERGLLPRVLERMAVALEEAG